MPTVPWLASQTGCAASRPLQDQVALPAFFSKMAFIATRFCTGQPATPGRQALKSGLFLTAPKRCRHGAGEHPNKRQTCPSEKLVGEPL
jgi:hypothetical protein